MIYFMKKLVFVFAFLFLAGVSLASQIGVASAANNVSGLNDSEDVNSSLKCKNFYWIDNENKSCEQKEFCGAYMYQGLQTFENKGECESASKRNYCTSKPDFCTLEYMPVCGNDEVTYGNGCNACGSGAEYWTLGECENKTKIFNLSNGRGVEIKIMPETASERAIERLGELNFTIELKEVGSGNQTRAAYEVRTEKQGKFLGLFKVRTNVSVEVDAESGEVIREHRPWWALLASGI